MLQAAPPANGDKVGKRLIPKINEVYYKPREPVASGHRAIDPAASGRRMLELMILNILRRIFASKCDQTPQHRCGIARTIDYTAPLISYTLKSYRSRLSLTTGFRFRNTVLLRFSSAADTMAPKTAQRLASNQSTCEKSNSIRSLRNGANRWLRRARN